MEHVTELLIVKDKNALHKDNICGINCDALISFALVALEVVGWNLDNLGSLGEKKKRDGILKTGRQEM